MSLCQYHNVFGEPNKGIHKHFMGIAIVDVLMTIIASYIISKNTNYLFSHVLIILFLSAIVLHRLFCVNTTVNKAIFGTV